MEQWRDVPGFEGVYQASSHGRVRTVARTSMCRHGGKLVARKLKQRPLSICLNAYGYPVASICNERGKYGPRAVHILVCSAFHGARPEGMEAAHIDGNRANARPENLRWATKLENERDKIRHGTQNTRDNGSRNVKLTSEGMAELLRLKGGPVARQEVARRFGITEDYVRQLWKRAA